MLNLDRDVNTHPNPNLSLTSEIITIQMVATQPQWRLHLHATQVRYSCLQWRWVIKNEIFCGVDLISTFCRQHLSKIHLVWGGWLYGCPKSVCCV